jgi:hypothetical protein
VILSSVFKDGSTLEIENNASILSLTRNHFEETNEHVMIEHIGGILNLRCNTFEGYHINAKETYVNMSVPERGGYNYFYPSSQFQGTYQHYIGFDQTSDLRLFDGYNTFEDNGGVNISRFVTSTNNDDDLFDPYYVGVEWSE